MFGRQSGLKIHIPGPHPRGTSWSSEAEAAAGARRAPSDANAGGSGDTLWETPQDCRPQLSNLLSGNTVLLGEQESPSWHSHVFSNNQCEASLLIYPKSKKRTSLGHFLHHHYSKKQVIHSSFVSLWNINWWDRLVGPGWGGGQEYHSSHCSLPWVQSNSFTSCVKASLRCHGRDGELGSTIEVSLVCGWWREQNSE